MKKLTKFEKAMLEELRENYIGENDDCYSVTDEMFCKLIALMVNSDSDYKATYIKQFSKGLINVSCFAEHLLHLYTVEGVLR